MMTIDSIKQQLQAGGIKPENLGRVIREVNEIIFGKVWVFYRSELNTEQREKLESLPEAEVVDYVKEHKAEFPPIEGSVFEKIWNETWSDYFSNLNA